MYEASAKMPATLCAVRYSTVFRSLTVHGQRGWLGYVLNKYAD